MSWRPISSFVHELRSHAAASRLHLPGADLRAESGVLALDVYGASIVEQTSLVNLAALALAMSDRLVVHEIRMPVPQVVAETDMHSLPAEPPRLLRAPWILEVRTPGSEYLFGRTASLAGYEVDGTTFLIGLDYPDGVSVAPWRPSWPGGDLAEGTAQELSPLVDDVEVHQAWAREAARFAVVLGLLLDATGSPLREREEGPRLAGARHGKPRPACPWVTRRVYLESRGAASASPGSGADATPERGDRVEARVEVRGHLKRQPYGPGGRERRWIYVAGYGARRWIAPRPLRVVVADTPRR